MTVSVNTCELSRHHARIRHRAWTFVRLRQQPAITGSPAFNQLDGLFDAAGVNVLRYPAAATRTYSISRCHVLGGITGNGLSPWWGERRLSQLWLHGAEDGLRKLRANCSTGTNSKTVITVNTGSAIKYTSPTSHDGVPTHNGQPQEAAAWVAYANADARVYGTPQDIALGVDCGGQQLADRRLLGQASRVDRGRVHHLGHC